MEKDEQRFYLSAVISMLAVFICPIFFMYAGVSASDLAESSEKFNFVSLPITFGFIGIVASIFAIYYFLKKVDFFDIALKKPGKALVTIVSTLIIPLFYLIQILFIKSWYDNEFTKVSVIITYIYYFISFQVLMFSFPIWFEFLFEIEKPFLKLIFVITSISLLFLWCLPVGFIIYHRDIYIKTPQQTVTLSPSDPLYWFNWFLSIMFFVFLLWYSYKFIQNKSNFERKRKEFSESDEIDFSSSHSLKGFKLNLNINYFMGVSLLVLSGLGIHYLMNQQGMFSEKSSTSLYVTELVWLVGCIAPAIYFLFMAIVNKNRFMFFEKKMFEESEDELLKLKKYLHKLETGEKLEENIS